MVRVLLVMLLAGASLNALAADDLKVSQLEQDVRDLQRQVQRARPPHGWMRPSGRSCNRA